MRCTSSHLLPAKETQTNVVVDVPHHFMQIEHVISVILFVVESARNVDIVDTVTDW